MLTSHASSTSELRFEDLFCDFDEEGADSDNPSPEGPDSHSPKDKGISALTQTLHRLQHQPPNEQSMADLDFKWSALHTQDGPTRMGSSAPVWIPQRNFTWSAQRCDRLHYIDEKEVVFIPPHLTVEQPEIQFSLNSGIAEKRAKLRAREKILKFTGFIEPEEQTLKDASDFRIPTRGMSELSRELGGRHPDTVESKDLYSAKRVVENQTGVCVEGYIRAEDYVTAQFPPGDTKLARLYICYGVPKRNLTQGSDTTIVDVTWRDFRSILEIPDGTPFTEESVTPFLPQLREWVRRRPHLRAEPDLMIGAHANFSRSRHSNRESYAAVLNRYLSSFNLPDARLWIIQPAEVMYAKDIIPHFTEPTYACVCSIPHFNVDITPEICYLNQEDAKEMASIAAFMFLIGALNGENKAFHVVPSGSPISNKPFWNEQVAAYAKICREGSILNENMSYWHMTGHDMIPAVVALPYKNTLKTAISQLRGFCSKLGHSLKFEFERKGEGYIGLVTVPELSLFQFSGDWKQHKREAKENVAVATLESLKEKGMIPLP